MMNELWLSFVILYQGIKPIINTVGFFILANILFHVLKCSNKYLKRNIKQRFYKKNNETNERFKTARECIDNYITYLERDDNREKLSGFEKGLLEWYTLNFSIEKRKREIDKEKIKEGDLPSLPVWMEDIIRVVNHPIIINLSIFLLFFLSVMIIGLSLSCTNGCNGIPIADSNTTKVVLVFENLVPPILTRDEIISSSINRNITHCKNTTGLYNYCYIEESDEAIITDFIRYTSTQLNNPVISKWDPTHHQPAMITNLHSLYYLLQDGPNSSIMVNRVALKNRLESIRRDEEKRGLDGSICVCPSYLGIYGNITFIYNGRDSGWKIMFNPVIHRNNTLSTLVMSTIRYHFNSNFFVINQHIQQLYNLNDLEHYDSFVVQYDIEPRIFTEVPSGDPSDSCIESFSPFEVLSQMNSKIKKLDDSPILLAKIKTFEKATVHLTANDAICFTYCDRLNRETMIK